MIYGLYDVRDRCWLGNKDGPLTYVDHHLARMAATVMTEQFKRGIQARPYKGDATHLKDEVTPELSAIEAIQKIEGRAG